MNSTIKDLYKAMRNMQFELGCERAMRQVEMSTKYEFIKLTNDNYNQLLIKEKNYFLQFFNVMTQKYGSDSKLQRLNKDLINGNNLSPKMHILPFPLFQQLVDKLLENDGKKLKDQTVQYFLTFSLFPALASYYTIDFITSNLNPIDPTNYDFALHDYNGTIQYLVELGKSDNDINCQILIELFMKPMFASPSFVRFITETFQPSFSLLQDQIEENETSENIDSLFAESLDKIKSNMNNNLHLIPSFLVYTIQLIEHPDEIIERCFLNLALETPEQSIAYGLFHFSKKPEIELLRKIKQLIFHNKSLIDSMLSCFSQSLVLRAIIKTKNEESVDMTSSNFDLLFCSEEDKVKYSLFKRESMCYFAEFMFQKKEFKGLFQTFILSRTDVNLINYIMNGNGNVPFKCTNDDANSQFKFYPFFLHFPNDDYGVYYTNDGADFDVCQLNSLRNYGSNDDSFSPSLRHLLQCSDPLPQFIDEFFPSDLNVENFLMKYLVLRGDVSSLSARLKYHADIVECLKGKNEVQKITELMNVLPSTLLEMTYEIEILTVASLIEERIQNIKNFILYFTLNQLSILNQIVSLDKAKAGNKIVTKSKSDYLENQNIIAQVFDYNLRKIFPGIETNYDQNIYILLKMIEKKKNTFFSKDNLMFFELKKFCIKKKPEVIIFDDQLKDALNNNFDELIDYAIKTQFDKKRNSKKNRQNGANKKSNQQQQQSTSGSQIVQGEGELKNNKNTNGNENNNNNNNNDNNNNNNDNNNNNNNNDNNNNNNDNNNNNNNNDNNNNNNDNNNNNNNNDNNNNDNNNNNNNDNNNNNNNDNNNNNNNNDNNNNDNDNNNNNNNDNRNNNNNNNDNNNNNNNNNNDNRNNNNNNNNDNDDLNDSIEDGSNRKERNIPLVESKSSGIDDRSSEQKFNKMQFIIDKLTKLKDEKGDLISLIHESLLETSIFRKFELFSNFFVKVKMYFFDGYPKDEELGSDELTSILSVIVLMSKSPNLQLNLEFINLFIPIYDRCFIDLFNEFRYFLEAAKSVFNLYYLSKY